MLINMKKIFCLVAASMLAASSFIAGAQTPKEIVSRMDNVVKDLVKKGFAMDLEIEYSSMVKDGPIMKKEGPSRICILGNKVHITPYSNEANHEIWIDGEKIMIYSGMSNELHIIKDTTYLMNYKMLFHSLIADNYDIESETDQAWNLKSTSTVYYESTPIVTTSRVTIDKKTYYPVSVSTCGSSNQTTFSNISFGVSEDEVTFNPEDYPEVVVITD